MHLHEAKDEVVEGRGIQSGRLEAVKGAATAHAVTVVPPRRTSWPIPLALVVPQDLL
jgi:hypothetical protein